MLSSQKGKHTTLLEQLENADGTMEGLEGCCSLIAEQLEKSRETVTELLTGNALTSERTALTKQELGKSKTKLKELKAVNADLVQQLQQAALELQSGLQELPRLETKNSDLADQLQRSQESVSARQDEVDELREKLKASKAEVVGLEASGMRTKYEDRYYQCVWPLDKEPCHYLEHPDGMVCMLASVWC